MTAPAFLTVVPGSLVSSRDQRFEVTHLLSPDAVLARNLDTKDLERLTLNLLHPDPGPQTTAAQPQAPAGEELGGHSQEDWQVAQRRFAAIRPLLAEPYRTRDMVKAAARAAGVGPVTFYAWLRLYADTGRVSALIPAKRGRKAGTQLLSPEAEAVLAATIEDIYLTPQKRRPQQVVDAVAERCRAANIAAPHPNTVRNRLYALPAAIVLRRRGQRDVARNKLEPVRGAFPGADFPLAVVQVDHSKADVVVVDERTRQAMGRPWITVAIDVFSRMVVGVYVSMDAPSAVAVGMCLSRAMLPKAEYLAELDVPGDWPACGRMSKVHADNAREFRGAMLMRACEEYGIDLDMRPGGQPHYGGHIERFMGTAANEIRNLPGATFSSPAERGRYKSDAKSALTLAEFERHLVDFLVNIYHRRVHSELRVPPVRQWQVGIMGDGERKGTGLPGIPADPDRLRLDFMPSAERTVQPYGIVIDDIYYYDEVLNPWIDAREKRERKRKRQFTIRRDPRDISQVHFFDPEAKAYFTIPYRDTTHPPVSIWEVRGARQRLQEEGVLHTDEAAIFGAIERMRQRTAEAVTKTKAARRDQHRIDRIKRPRAAATAPPQAGDDRPGLAGQGGTGATGQDGATQALWNEQAGGPEKDIFAEPVLPFDGIVATRSWT